MIGYSFHMVLIWCWYCSDKMEPWRRRIHYNHVKNPITLYQGFLVTLVRSFDMIWYEFDAVLVWCWCVFDTVRPGRSRLYQPISQQYHVVSRFPCCPHTHFSIWCGMVSVWFWYASDMVLIWPAVAALAISQPISKPHHVVSRISCCTRKNHLLWYDMVLIWFWYVFHMVRPRRRQLDHSPDRNHTTSDHGFLAALVRSFWYYMIWFWYGFDKGIDAVSMCCWYGRAGAVSTISQHISKPHHIVSRISFCPHTKCTIWCEMVLMWFWYAFDMGLIWSDRGGAGCITTYIETSSASYQGFRVAIAMIFWYDMIWIWYGFVAVWIWFWCGRAGAAPHRIKDFLVPSLIRSFGSALDLVLTWFWYGRARAASTIPIPIRKPFHIISRITCGPHRTFWIWYNMVLIWFGYGVNMIRPGSRRVDHNP